MIDLFGVKPRRSRRQMMHVIDAGADNYGNAIAVFKCSKCGHETDWIDIEFENTTKAKRGEPCPVCNTEEI